MLVGKYRRQIGKRLQRGNRLQVVSERRRPRLLYRILIHARVEKIADLLLIRRSRRVCLSGLQQESPEVELIIVSRVLRRRPRRIDREGSDYL